jgi:serine/threonine protein kinase
MSNLEGAILSDYLLLECISRGSVADVYRARQNDGQYEVAVKIFRPAYAQREAFRTHFLSEAEKIGQFDHPHILPFIEYGEGEGLLYSVTPFVKSGTLEELLKNVGGRFSAMQALPVVEQLCNAVQYAHEHDVMHGNIKPRNVFVANDGRMLLADFGIMRGYADGQLAFEKMEWSATQYAAPEQSLGLLRRSCDIYALGAIFFRLLTGSPVFVGQTPVEVLLKHVRQEPPLARSLEPGISDVVDAVLQKALKKRADDRYVTASELSQAFAAAVSCAPVASPVAREITMTTRPLSFDFQPSAPLSVASIAMQATAPTMPIVPFQASQASLIALPPELIQQSAPQPSVLPEQHGLTSSSYTEPAFSAPCFLDQATRRITDSPYWSHEPVEWSPLPQTRQQNADEYIPLGAADHEHAQQSLALAPEREQAAHSQQRRKQKRLLPVLVVILLILGLLAALLSSFFLPAPATRGAGWHASPPVTSDIFRA